MILSFTQRDSESYCPLWLLSQHTAERWGRSFCRLRTFELIPVRRLGWSRTGRGGGGLPADRFGSTGSSVRGGGGCSVRRVVAGSRTQDVVWTCRWRLSAWTFRLRNSSWMKSVSVFLISSWDVQRKNNSDAEDVQLIVKQQHVVDVGSSLSKWECAALLCQILEHLWVLDHTSILMTLMNTE